jgi:hypothetical protein
MRGGADEEPVDAAAPKLGLLGRDVAVDGSIRADVVEVFEAGTAGFEVEFAACREDSVVDGFGVETARVLSPEKAVVGIECGGFGIRGERGLPGSRFLRPFL